MLVAKQPSLVSTVLGSCVSVTMHTRRSRISAICHAILPSIPIEMLNSDRSDECFKYVDSSIHYMLETLLRYGVKRTEVEVKLFGGSSMFETEEQSHRLRTSVGEQNIETALQVIESERLNLVASDVGECLGRKIFFHTHTGEILLKRLKGMKNGSENQSINR